MENVRAISVIASFVDQKSNSSMYKTFRVSRLREKTLVDE